MELKKSKLFFKASSHISGVLSSCQEGKNFGGNEGNRASGTLKGGLMVFGSTM